MSSSSSSEKIRQVPVYRFKDGVFDKKYSSLKIASKHENVDREELKYSIRNHKELNGYTFHYNKTGPDIILFRDDF